MKLRKTYLVSTDRFNKDNCPVQHPYTETKMWRKPASPKKQNNRHVQAKKKKKKTKQRQHPYHKRVTFREKMREAEDRHTALIKKMADFLRNVLTDTK